MHWQNLHSTGWPTIHKLLNVMTLDGGVIVLCFSEFMQKIGIRAAARTVNVFIRQDCFAIDVTRPIAFLRPCSRYCGTIDPDNHCSSWMVDKTQIVCPNDLGTNPEFSPISEPNERRLFSQINLNSRPKMSSVPTRKFPKKGRQLKPKMSDIKADKFLTVWDKKQRNFVPYVPPSIFADYRHVILSARYSNVFEEIGKNKNPDCVVDLVDMDIDENENDVIVVDERTKEEPSTSHKTKTTTIQMTKTIEDHHVTQSTSIHVMREEDVVLMETSHVTAKTGHGHVTAKTEHGHVAESASIHVMREEDIVFTETEEGHVTEERIHVTSERQSPDVIVLDEEEEEVECHVTVDDLLAELSLIPPERLPTDSISENCASGGRIRQWDSAVIGGDLAGLSSSSNPWTFTICSYNVLSQETIPETMYLYRHLPRNARELQWPSRWRKLAREFKTLDADIYCLQEVTASHYESHYLKLMEKLGYCGVFKKRTGAKGDGCALFWRGAKFRVIQSHPMDFHVPGTVLDRDNIGLLVLLEPVDGGGRLVVGTTHLLYNPRRGDVKLCQLALFLTAAARLSGPDRHPAVLCGDFNMHPLSPMYNLIMEGLLRYEGLPRAEVSGQGRQGGPLLDRRLLPPEAGVSDVCQPLDDLPPQDDDDCLILDEPMIGTGVLRHPFQLLSVYRHVTPDGDCEVTTKHSQDSANVDYIFYSIAEKRVFWNENQLRVAGVKEDRLRCLERYRLLSDWEMEWAVGKLPNRFCGSDHVPLMAKFEYVK